MQPSEARGEQGSTQPSQNMLTDQCQAQPRVPALGRLRQEDLKFETRLDYCHKTLFCGGMRGGGQKKKEKSQKICTHHLYIILFCDMPQAGQSFDIKHIRAQAWAGCGGRQSRGQGGC